MRSYGEFSSVVHSTERVVRGNEREGLMNQAEEIRNEAIRKLSDVDLLDRVLSDRSGDVSTAERKAFQEMRGAIVLEERTALSKRQRAWTEEACRRIMPINAADVPRGREVATPHVLQNLPMKPPGRE